jgi:hypothetical protein
MLDGNSAAESRYAADQARAVRNSDPYLEGALDYLVENVMSNPLALGALREEHPGEDDAALERRLRELLRDSDTVSELAAEFAEERHE